MQSIEIPAIKVLLDGLAGSLKAVHSNLLEDWEEHAYGLPEFNAEGFDNGGSPKYLQMLCDYLHDNSTALDADIVNGFIKMLMVPEEKEQINLNTKSKFKIKQKY